MGAEQLHLRLCQLSAEVISSWFYDPKFREAWQPEPDLFVLPAHRACAEVMAERGASLDDGALTLELKRRGKLKLFGDEALDGGAQAVGDLIHGTASTQTGWSALDKLREAVALRRLRQGLQDALREIESGLDLATARELVSKALTSAQTDTGVTILTEQQVLKAAMDQAMSERRKPGAMTGARSLDIATGGIRRGHVWVFGADTNWGKSSWLCMLADIALRQGRHPLIVTGEDPETLYGARLLARRTNVDAMRLRDAALDMYDRRAVTDVVNVASQKQILLDARGRSAEAIAADIRSACAIGVDLVLVDYIQAFRSQLQHQDKRTEVAHIGRIFTDAIKLGGAGGVMFSQITKDPTGKHPTKDSIRETRDLSHAAEVVALGYSVKKEKERKLDRYGRPVPDDNAHDATEEKEEERKFLFLDKNKDGPKGWKVELKWDDRTASFCEQGYAAEAAE